MGTCRGEQSSRMRRLMVADEILVEHRALSQHDEQHHPQLTVTGRRGDVHHERVEDLVHRARGTVDLAGAHAHALAVDGGVRAAVDHGAAPGRDADPVAVAPDARVHREVALAQALAVVVAPQEQRHRGHRLGDDELADLVREAPALLVPGLHRAAERAALQFTLVHRQQRAARHERRADVGAAAGREQPDVRSDVLVDPSEALGRQRRARRADCAQRFQVVVPARLDARLLAAREQAGADAHAGDLSVLIELPQHAQVGVGGTAVVEHDRGFAEQAADEEVPHHPAGRGEPEHAVVRAQVEVQALLQLLDQDPAVALHDRLRQAGGAGRVEDPQRMVERDLLEAELGTLAAAQQLSPGEPRGSARAAGSPGRPGRRRPRAGRAEARRARRSAARRRCCRRPPCGRSPCRRDGSRRP